MDDRTDFLGLEVRVIFRCRIIERMSRKHLENSTGIFRASTSPVEDEPPARPEKRKFVSHVIERKIEVISSQIVDCNLATVFSNCFPNTLDTTIEYFDASTSNPDTFVITGDIPALWLRDSANQVLPYVRYCSEDEGLARLIEGLIMRQSRSVLIDPYANAFNFDADGPADNPWQNDKRIPVMQPSIWEGKFELDSLCSHLHLSYRYWKATANHVIFQNKVWRDAVEVIVATMTEQQKGSWDKDPDNPDYFFARESSAPTDTLMHGVGSPCRRTGMVRSPFRPSDDAATYLFPVAANAFAVVSLRNVAEMFGENGPCDDPQFAQVILALAETIDSGIRQHGTVEHPIFGSIFAYEVDGYGNHILMDDSNLPSLLSLPYLGWCDKTDPVYINTRRFVLSDSNPWFFRGQAGEGIGGPHVGLGWVWPLSIIMQATTSFDDCEIQRCITTLLRSCVGTGLMHESFQMDDAKVYTRPWFAWANSQFGHLIVTLAEQRPHLLKVHYTRSPTTK